MFTYIGRLLTALSVTFACYWVYTLVAVPLIEPTVMGQTVDDPDDENPEPLTNAERDKLLASLFPAEAWQRNRPKQC